MGEHEPPRQRGAGVSRLRQSQLVVDGVRTPVLEAGPEGATEAVVFVHGNPGSSRDWEDLASAVGQFGRAIAVDMPGFGKAERPAVFDYTVGGYTAFLAAALRELGVGRAHLVVHNFGGVWGLVWAAQNPTAFGSAVLINAGVLTGYRWHYLAKIWRTPVLGEFFMATTTRAGFRLLLRHGNPRGLPPAFIDRMYDDFDAGTKRAVLRLYRATNAGAMGGLAATLRQLDRPALVVWGKRDPYIPFVQAARQRESFPHAQVAILEDSGHWPYADNPQRVAELVVPFLRNQLTGTKA
jgi:pimeloyl-ACP methyl ester carboxylesterase